ncbi:hypothetical protein, partial [Acinetobacter baumannii]|uniref:hypothetical protein n=3 Tax=Acinetobacter baumannii TaxID=470 RepID=UPI0006A050B7
MLNLQLPKNIKLEILKILAKQEGKLFQKIDEVSFFDLILDLRSLPSTDSRYRANSNMRCDSLKSLMIIN